MDSSRRCQGYASPSLHPEHAEGRSFSSGALRLADRPRPSTRRVSAGIDDATSSRSRALA